MIKTYDEQQQIIKKVIDTSDTMSIVFPNTRCSRESFAIYEMPATIPAGDIKIERIIKRARVVPEIIFSFAASQRRHLSEPSASGREQFIQ